MLSEFRERLHDWLRLALRKDSGKADALRAGDAPHLRAVGALIDGPDAEQLKASTPRAACPKMVGEWSCKQESQITGDERVLPRVQLTLHAKLSIPQVRWNFLRSQSVEQLGDGDIDESSDYATLDFAELQEALVRCALDMFEKTMAHVAAVARPQRLHARRRRCAPSCACCSGRRPSSTSMWEASLIRPSGYDASDRRRRCPGSPTASSPLPRVLGEDAADGHVRLPAVGEGRARLRAATTLHR